MKEEVEFEVVLRSLRRSRVRTEIVMYLYKIYPKASYPAEISRNTGIDPTNILGGLMPRVRFLATGLWRKLSDGMQPTIGSQNVVKRW